MLLVAALNTVVTRCWHMLQYCPAQRNFIVLAWLCRFQLQTEPIARAGVVDVSGQTKAPYYTSMHQATRSLLKEEGMRTLWR